MKNFYKKTCYKDVVDSVDESIELSEIDADRGAASSSSIAIFIRWRIVGRPWGQF